ncbi:MAG TPA: helix-turn-helix domain-containing protein [Solirubrobacterales bacterium]|nr:helix-turn-helix domain-containing protein [Solirubrobacterales bacterium]
MLKVLGDPIRIRLVELLNDRGSATVSALTACVSVSQPTVSNHLAVLHLGEVSPSPTAPEVAPEALPEGRLGAQLRRGAAHHRPRSTSSTRLTRADLGIPSPLDSLPRATQVRLATPRSMWLM